jgi:hypothetical protein
MSKVMAQQKALPRNDLADAINDLSQSSVTDRGAIFTRREVVNFILDLTGYTADRPLHSLRLLEPSFGVGDFLIPVVDRLMTAYKQHVSIHSRNFEELKDAIQAVEVHQKSFKDTQAKLLDLLRLHGVSEVDARCLVESWLIAGDFLLVNLTHSFTYVVGNPPYVRQELIPDVLMNEYRARYSTIYDRADLYVPFIERSLSSLEPEGVLGFICADRWTKNRYGGPLRAMVADQYHLACYVDMTDTPAFQKEVSSYPAITIIERKQAGPTRLTHHPQIDRNALAEISHAMRADTIPKGSGVMELTGVVDGHEPWLLQSFDQLAVVRRLESDFPLIEDAGCKVGIGVATGADRVFIGPFESLDVEPDRKLPLVKTKDIQATRIEWQGLGVINPFHRDGSLVDLANYPRLARYFEKYADVLRNRHCARKNPKAWYRTIDRINSDLTYRPKLLIPDIKGHAHFVFEEGRLYPHHNLYVITSNEWDLRALRVVLRSGIAKLIVLAYSTKLRGGYLRYQAQYLRRIRLPRWRDVPFDIRKALVGAAIDGDIEAGNHATFDLYQLTPQEQAVIRESE